MWATHSAPTQSFSACYGPDNRKGFVRLKIIGQTGELGQKDKLSFVSLARQIEGALQKSYKALEVVDVAVRSINLGMRLRRYLEGLESLTLPLLRCILRFHYQEKSATELINSSLH